ncbi:MAG: flippase-like domain-containing protein, partial [bacterium]|nr:flippase-like domain-containing protein [bacterium]
VLLGYIAYYIIENRESFLILKSIGPIDIGALFAAFFCSLLVSSVRLLMVMKKFGLKEMRFFPWFRIFVLARFFNRLVPQGGNVFRALTLKKENRFPLKNYTLSFLNFTWVDLVVSFTLISVIIYRFQPGLKIGEIPVLYFSLGLVPVFIAGPLLFYLAVKRMRVIQDRKGVFVSFLKALAAMVEQTLGVKFLLKNILLCIFSFGLVLLWFYLGFHSIGVETGIGALAVFTAIMRMSLLVSITPGNLGVLELAYGTLASSFGLDFSTGIIVAAVTRVVSFTGILILGVSFGGIPLIKTVKKERGREPE